MLNFIQLQEKRKNATINKKPMSGMQELLNFLDQLPHLNTVFISMTMLPKLGINPQSVYNTPIGIYSYPAYYVKQQGMDFLEEDFQGNAPYFNVFKVKNPARLLNIQQEDRRCYQLIEELKELYSDYKAEIIEFYQESSTNALQTNAGGRLWYILWKLSSLIAETKGGSAPIIWNTLFRKLNIDGVEDTASSQDLAIIHSNEPTQAVFFSGKSVQLINRIRNITPRWQLKDQYQLLNQLSSLIKQKKFEAAYEIISSTYIPEIDFPIFYRNFEVFTLDTMPHDIQNTNISLSLYNGKIPASCKDLYFSNCTFENVKTLKDFPMNAGVMSIRKYQPTNASLQVSNWHCLYFNGKVRNFELGGSIDQVELTAEQLTQLNCKSLECEHFAITSNVFTQLNALPKNTTELTLKLNHITDLTDIPATETLYLHNCSRLLSLKGIDKTIKKLYIRRCESLQSVKDIPKWLKLVVIVGCESLASWDGLDQVKGRVKISSCPSLDMDKIPYNISLNDVQN